MLKSILSKIPKQILKGQSKTFTAVNYAKFDNLSMVIVEKMDDNVGLITLDRPERLNALCDDMYKELIQVLQTMDSDKDIRCIVLTGSQKAFAAGADIKEMKDKVWPESYMMNMLGWWENINYIRTPLIAAVNGYALGGGCELAMMCDIIYAGDFAKFGQPEITLGTVPGMGGS